MKVSCSGGGGPQTFAIPCNEPTACVGSLKSLALDRWSENRGDNSKRDAERYKLTLSGTGALLSDKDAIQDVLKDGEFLDLCERAEHPPTSYEKLSYHSAGSVDAPRIGPDACCSRELPAYGLYPHLYPHTWHHAFRTANYVAH